MTITNNGVVIMLTRLHESFAYQGATVVPQEQIGILAGALKVLLPKVPDQELESVFKINALSLASRNPRAELKRKLDDLENDVEGGYVEGYARLLVECLMRGSSYMDADAADRISTALNKMSELRGS